MSTAKSKLKGFLAGILIAISYGALAVTYNYFSPGGALSCVAPCTSQNVDLTVSGSVNGPLRVGAGGTGTNSTLVGIVRGGSPLTSSELSGDVVTSGSNATTIQTNVVTNAKAAQMAANTIKGNNAGGLANAVDLTTAQAQALLSIPAAANPSGLVGLSAVNGVATTYDRSDSVHALDQAIAPTMTGVWNFTNSITSKIAATDAFKVCPTNGNLIAGNIACGSEPSVVTNGALLIQVNVAGLAQPIFSRNINSGATAGALIEVGNDTIAHELVMGTTSTNQAGAVFTHGPTGEQKYIYTPTAKPFCLGSNNDVGFCITTTNALQGVGPVNAVLTDMTPDSSTFTATYTGFTANPTCTSTWARVGKLVTLLLCAATATSNANTFTLTGLPTAIRPTTNQVVTLAPGHVLNLGAILTVAIAATISNSTTISFDLAGSATGWGVTGTKGITEAISVSYQLN